MIKITFIIDSLLVAGAQVHLLRLASGLQSKNIDVELICLGNVDETLVASYCIKKIRSMSMPSIRKTIVLERLF